MRSPYDDLQYVCWGLAFENAAKQFELTRATLRATFPLTYWFETQGYALYEPQV
jgi:hypothetical protein